MCYGAKYFSSLPVACKSITSKRSNWYDQRKLQHGEDEDADEDEKRRDRKVAMVTDDTITPVITHNNKQKNKTSQYSSCLIIHLRRDEFSCWWRSFNCVTQAATVGVARNNKRERRKKKFFLHTFCPNVLTATGTRVTMTQWVCRVSASPNVKVARMD